jgi:integral membrane sensor domain MASE1
LARATVFAYLLTALGMLGIIIALVTEQSDYDPTAFGIATVSILVAVIGISLALRAPKGEEQPKELSLQP